MKKLILGILALTILSVLYGCTEETLEIPQNFEGDACAYITNLRDQSKIGRWCRAHGDECKMHQDICVPIEYTQTIGVDVCQAFNNILDESKKKLKCDYYGEEFGCIYMDGECLTRETE